MNEIECELMQGEPPDDWPDGAYLTPYDRDLPYEFQVDDEEWGPDTAQERLERGPR